MSHPPEHYLPPNTTALIQPMDMGLFMSQTPIEHLGKAWNELPKYNDINETASE